METLANGVEGLKLDEKLYRIGENEEVGRHIVVTKDITQGQVVFQDHPIVVGPSRSSDPVCISCYKTIDLTRRAVRRDDAADPPVTMDTEEGALPYVACPRCQWAVCSLACANSTSHKPECFYLFTSGCRVNPEDTSSLYDVITVLRCLYLRDNNPGAWADLLNLQSTGQDESLAERGAKVAALVCGQIKLEGTFSREMVFQVCAILDINSFEVKVPKTSASVQAVYGVACMVEHQCIPNGHRTFNEDMSITMRAAYDLEEGDAVSITYTDTLWTTGARREHLVYSKNFLCICDRCKDPTENETYTSALKCMKCPSYYLPETPLDCNGAWKCKECGRPAPPGYSEMAEEKVAATIAKLEEEGLTVEACQKFLTVHTRALHPHHAHMLDIKYSLLNLLGHSEGQTMEKLTDEQLTTKEELANTFLDIASKLLPGISRLKGTSLYELSITTQQRAFNSLNNNADDINDVIGTFKLALDQLQRCIDCLQYEPSHQAEGVLCARAKCDRDDLIQLIFKLKSTQQPDFDVNA